MRRLFVFLPMAAMVFFLFSCSKHTTLSAPSFFWYTQRLDSLGVTVGVTYREYSSTASDSIKFNYDSTITETAYIPDSNKDVSITFAPTMPDGYQVAMSLPNQSVNNTYSFSNSLLYKTLAYNNSIVFKKKGNEVDITGGANEIKIGL